MPIGIDNIGLVSSPFEVASQGAFALLAERRELAAAIIKKRKISIACR